MRRETKFVIFVLGAWLCFALAVGISGAFGQASAPMVAGVVWALTVIALLAFWKIEVIRHWAATVDLRALIALHLARFVGIYFLLLHQRGQLPGEFAKPAGIGDIVVALFALIILCVPRLQRSRGVVITWNLLGLIDIVIVAFLALRCGLSNWHSMAPLRELPLSLLPTFLVPLIIASHVVIIVRMAAPENRPDSR